MLVDGIQVKCISGVGRIETSNASKSKSISGVGRMETSNISKSILVLVGWRPVTLVSVSLVLVGWRPVTLVRVSLVLVGWRPVTLVRVSLVLVGWRPGETATANCRQGTSLRGAGQHREPEQGLKEIVLSFSTENFREFQRAERRVVRARSRRDDDDYEEGNISN